VKRATLIKALVWLAVAAVLVAAFLYAKSRGWVELFTDKEALKDFVSGFGIWGPLVFVGMQFFQVILSFVPGNVTTLIGGALFGAGWAFVYSYVAVAAGSMVAFLIARRFGPTFVKALIGKKIYEKYFSMIQSQGALSRTRVTVVVTLLLPFFPDDMICFLAGLTVLPFWQFAVFVIVARPWGLLFSALAGDGAMKVPTAVMAAIAVVSIGVAVVAFRKADAIESFLLRNLEKLGILKLQAETPSDAEEQQER
jgi:uncharacterized membrane protein YdjX (TVP38/TMEM64 family)